jgi:cation transport ATPase
MLTGDAAILAPSPAARPDDVVAEVLPDQKAAAVEI